LGGQVFSLPPNEKTTIMGKVIIAKNLIHTRDTIDKNGNLISSITSTSPADKLKQLQEIRAQKLGFKPFKKNTQ
jgi:hypothetical protein